MQSAIVQGTVDITSHGDVIARLQGVQLPRKLTKAEALAAIKRARMADGPDLGANR